MFFYKDKTKIQKDVIEVICLISGTFIMACSTAFFLLPNQLSTGGFSGIATIAYYFFNIPLGTAMLILNLPLFLIAFFTTHYVSLGSLLVYVVALKVFASL